MDFLLSVLPEIITVVVAVGVAVARTTSNSLDNKVANLAQDNQKAIRQAIEGLIAEDKAKNGSGNSDSGGNS